MSRFFITAGVLIAIATMCNVARANADKPSSALIKALGRVESGGDDDAFGDKKKPQHAYGYLQIRQPVCDDINLHYGTAYRAQDCLGNRELSIWICEHYVDMYAREEILGRKPTDEDMARIWNAGPKGCFDNGAIDRYGHLPRNEKLRRRLAGGQRSAKYQYWQKKVKKALQKSS